MPKGHGAKSVSHTSSIFLIMLKNIKQPETLMLEQSFKSILAALYDGILCRMLNTDVYLCLITWK